jgi:hypothetical protein
MKTPLSAVALTAIVLALASASCTYSDETQAVGPIARAQAAAEAVTSLYPPVSEDAGDGHVHEYY